MGHSHFAFTLAVRLNPSKHLLSRTTTRLRLVTALGALNSAAIGVAPERVALVQSQCTTAKTIPARGCWNHRPDTGMPMPPL
jgi:hypothetical protein